jgi:glycosyltransferase involved in cell wall biosynthesis
MRIAILGTRGIPNNYGGFEQFAEYLSRGLTESGHDVFVYTSHDHPYQEKTWHGVSLIHIKNPEDKMGTKGQFLYDLRCILDSRKRGFDLILQLGYTSSSVWGRLLPSKAIIVTNMDGLEWKRTKFSKKVQAFLKYAEKLAVKTSDHLVADSIGIQSYLKQKYGVESAYIPYGTHVFNNPDEQKISAYGVTPYRYNMLIARIEPENNIETILDGVAVSSSADPFLVVGNAGNEFGKYLMQKFSAEPRIRFTGPNYDIDILNNLRYYSNLYFHGHSVGGTNPSLLEAMASGCLICAHQNEFNQSILNDETFYFSDKADVTKLLNTNISKSSFDSYVQANLKKIETLYLWPKIIKDYETLFINLSR